MNLIKWIEIIKSDLWELPKAVQVHSSSSLSSLDCYEMIMYQNPEIVTLMYLPYA